MRNLRSRVLGLWVLLSVTGAAFCAVPEQNVSLEIINEALVKAEELEAVFDDLVAGNAEIAALKAQVPAANTLRKIARDCIKETSPALGRTQTDIDKLGELPNTGEDAASAIRSELEEKRAAHEQLLLTCRLLLVKAETLSDQLEKRITDLRTRILLARYPGALAVALGPEPETLARMETLVRHHEQQLAYPRLERLWQIGFLLIVVLTLGTMALVHAATRRTPRAAPGPGAGFGAASRHAFSCALTRYGGAAAGILIIVAFWTVVAMRLQSFVPELGISLTLFTFLLALLGGRTFLVPVPPARHFLPFDETATHRFWSAVRFLAVVWSSASVLYFASFIRWPLTLALNVRFLYVLLFTIAIARVVWTFFGLSPRKGFGLIRLAVMLILAASVVAELAGYRNLSGFLLEGVMYSLGIVSAAWLTGRLMDDFLAGLEEGRHEWQRRVHSWMGIEEGGYLPGVIWLRLLVNLGIIGAVIWFLASAWGMPEATRSDILNYFTEGFQVGEVTVVPLRILVAVVLLAGLFSILSWLRRRLEETILSKSRVSIGARNAVSSIGSYIIATLAFLFALSVAGVDLTSLALIAGALSVGIGFGLQNVVNNFVSGLILLFERPIKQGDWIVVGSTEGYVKKISVRSTLITTFDNADVIVPNSELIANQVTNWMLFDLRGRVRVPVGVAYGSDVEKVREILLGISLSHPETVVDVNVPKPAVIFLSFGDSALNFELRFHIRNIDRRLSVLSDVNFAVEKAFREASITIPFPQTDVHLHYEPDRPRMKNSMIAGEEQGAGESHDPRDDDADSGGTDPH